jgi:hypothetical protein
MFNPGTPLRSNDGWTKGVLESPTFSLAGLHLVLTRLEEPEVDHRVVDLGGG